MESENCKKRASVVATHQLHMCQSVDSEARGQSQTRYMVTHTGKGRMHIPCARPFFQGPEDEAKSRH